MRFKSRNVLSTRRDLLPTAKGLGRSPHGLRAVKAHNVESVFEGLDTGLDIVHGALAIVAATVTEVWGARSVPHRRPCTIDTKRISILLQELKG